MFWQKVSSKVGSRTAEECQFQHQGQIVVSNKKDPSGKKGSVKEKKAPGQKGTLHKLSLDSSDYILVRTQSMYSCKVR